MKKVLPILLLVSLCALSSCNHTDNSTSASGNTSSSLTNLTDFTLSLEKPSIAIGETCQVTITRDPSSNNSPASFKSTDPNIATVTDSGLITGVSEGTTAINVTIEGKNKSINITVSGNSSKLDATQLGEALKATPYSLTEVEAQDKFGLSSLNVGVIENNVKAMDTVPSDDKFAQIIDANSLDLAQVQTVMPMETALSDYNKIQAAILMAKNANVGEELIKVKLTGTYEIDVATITSSTVLDMNELKNVYVQGDNATIRLLINDFNWKSYFRLDNAKNVHLSGLTFEMDVPASITGKVVASDTTNNTITLKISDEFNTLCSRLLANKRGIRSYVEFDARNKTAPRDNGNFVVDNFKDYTLTKKDDAYEMTITFKGSITRPRIDTYAAIQFSQYDAYGMTINNSENIYVENVTMHHAAGMAFTGSNDKNLYVNRFNLVVKENSEQLMTATADGMHFSMMQGDVNITNSIFEYSHDDAMNLKHGYWYKLDSVVAKDKKFTLSRLTSEMPLPSEGDMIEVYNEATFESYNPIKGYYTVASATKTSSGFEIVVNERPSNVANWGNARVTFTSNTPNVKFQNNIVRNKRNRGILIQVPGATIENNTFMNVGHGSIQAATAMDVYNEATMPQGTVIRNNKFINNCYIKPDPILGDISIFAISNNASVAPNGTLKNIEISNNFFNFNGNSCISLRGVSDTNIKDNFFYECSRTWPSGEIYNCLINLYNAEAIEVNGCYNQYTLDLGLNGLILQGTAIEDNVTLTNNHQVEFQPTEDAGPEVSVPKLTSAITIDGNLSDWETSNATDIEIIGASTADGIEVNMADRANHFAIKTLKIAHDDQGIYLAFDVLDDDINVKTIHDFWLGDCIEIFMSTITNMPNADMQVYKDDGGVLQAAFAPTWSSNGYKTLSTVRTNSSYLDKANLIEAKLVQTSDGYLGEVLIPFTFAPEFKTAIDNGAAIDMAIIVADCERNDIKRVQAGNIPHFVENYKTKTAKMPQYFFTK